MFPAGIKSISLAPAASLTATATGAAVDIKNVSGHALLVLNSSATNTAGNTSVTKIQHSADGSTGWTDSGVALTAVTSAGASNQSMEIDMDQFKRFIRVVDTLAGTTPAVTRSVQLIARADAS